MELKHKTIGSIGEPKKMSDVDLRSLIALGCVKEDVKIENMTFTLRSLNTQERRELVDFIGDSTESKKVFQFNLLLLAMAVESVNGKLLESLYVGDQTNPMDQKMEILANMQGSVIGKLLEEYNKVVSRADAMFTTEQVKK